MTDAVIYARVSSKEQSEGYSIDAQLRLLREYADKNKIVVIREFTEIETAKQSGRPMFREMLELINTDAKCQTILVEKTDRLYRNIKDWVTIDELGIDIHFVKEGMIIGPSAKSSDKFFHGIRVLMAKNYVDNLSEEIQKGMAEKVLSGGWPHRAPFGYRNTKGTVSVVPDPDKAEAIRWVYHRFAAGDISVRELYREFRRRYRYRLVQSTFSDRLRDPFYKGEILWRGDIYPGNHEPLVDERTWDRVQMLLDASTKPANQVSDGLFTYRGLITCDHCGCAIVGELKKGKYIYYHCTQNKGTCKDNGWIRQEELDRQYAESMRDFQLIPEVYDGVLKTIRDWHLKRAHENREAIGSLSEKARLIQDQITMMYRDKLDGDIPKSMWREEHANLSNDLREVHDQIRAYREADLSFYDAAEQILSVTSMAEKMFLEGDYSTRRELINMVYSNTVLCSGSLINTKKKPFDLIAKGRVRLEIGAYRTRTDNPQLAKLVLSH